jgi:hypothetical protein
LALAVASSMSSYLCRWRRQECSCIQETWKIGGKDGVQTYSSHHNVVQVAAPGVAAALTKEGVAGGMGGVQTYASTTTLCRWRRQDAAAEKGEATLRTHAPLMPSSALPHFSCHALPTPTQEAPCAEHCRKDYAVVHCAMHCTLRHALPTPMQCV